MVYETGEINQAESSRFAETGIQYEVVKQKDHC